MNNTLSQAQESQTTKWSPEQLDTIHGMLNEYSQRTLPLQKKISELGKTHEKMIKTGGTGEYAWEWNDIMHMYFHGKRLSGLENEEQIPSIDYLQQQIDLSFHEYEQAVKSFDILTQKMVDSPIKKGARTAIKFDIIDGIEEIRSAKDSDEKTALIDKLFHTLFSKHVLSPGQHKLITHTKDNIIKNFNKEKED